MRDEDRSRRRRNRRAARAAAGGTVTIATLGLSNCDNGCGTSVDPLPPPPLVCKDARHGQNFLGYGEQVDSLLTVRLHSTDYYPGVDTAYVTNLTGATLDSLQVAANFFELSFILDSSSTTQVTFTFAGTFLLDAGPCNFSRDFTVTITGGDVQVALVGRELPLFPASDLRIEIVERTGNKVRLRPAGAGSGAPVWSVTGGEFDLGSDGEMTWQLPPEAGFYQAELYVERGDDGFGFDTLSFEVV